MVNILTFFLHLAHSEQIFVACPSILILTNCIPEVYLDQLHYVENGNKVLFVVDVAGVGLFVWLQAVSTGGESGSAYLHGVGPLFEETTDDGSDLL